MARLKCIACPGLHRVAMKRISTDAVEIYYECSQGLLPYLTSVGGLFRPAKGIKQAATECPITQTHCILCESEDREVMGLDIKLCVKHVHDWYKWLDKNPEKDKYATERGYGPQPQKWLEVFREWVEEARK